MKQKQKIKIKIVANSLLFGQKQFIPNPPPIHAEAMDGWLRLAHIVLFDLSSKSPFLLNVFQIQFLLNF